MNKPYFLFLQTIILFLILLSIGFRLATQKPLWNDEAYSQTCSIQALSYGQIIKGENHEGNICPLFYLIQKWIGNLAYYNLPTPWDGNTITDPKAQLIFRIAPNICMSLAIALLFYFFTKFYSWLFGIYALLLSLTSFMVWAYWAEARPYALWFLLTTLQLLIFLQVLKTPNKWEPWRLGLLIVHFLLSFTVVSSAIQIAAVSVLLWIFKEKNWKKYIYTSIVPMAICLYYYSHTHHDPYWVKEPLEQLLNPNIPPDMLWFGGIYFIFILLNQKRLFQKSMEGLAFFLLMSLLYLLTLGMVLKINHGHSPTERYEMSPRYFIFLAPLGIIATTVFIKNLVDLFQNKQWPLWVLTVVVVGALIMRWLHVYPLILGLYSF